MIYDTETIKHEARGDGSGSFLYDYAYDAHQAFHPDGAGGVMFSHPHPHTHPHAHMMMKKKKRARKKPSGGLTEEDMPRIRAPKGSTCLQCNNAKVCMLVCVCVCVIL